MTNIDVKIFKNNTNSHDINENVTGNSISDLIASLRRIKESTNQYLSKLVEEEKLEAQTNTSQKQGN